MRSADLVLPGSAARVAPLKRHGRAWGKQGVNGFSKDVSVNGLRFHCRVDGPEGAPWLVLSNSLNTNLSLWDPQVAAFGARFRILRYDQRGHGRTEVPPGPATLDALVDDAAKLMEAFGARNAVFAGVSMGAATALCLAARSPGLVARAVASDGQAGTAPGGARGWGERIEFARAHGMDAVADATVQRWFPLAFAASGGPDLRRAREMIRTTPLDGMVACAQALQDYDFRAELPRITQPTLLIVGAEDGAMPQSMRAIHAVIPGSRFVEIPGAGHLPGLEKPDEFNAALASFLAETGG